MTVPSESRDPKTHRKDGPVGLALYQSIGETFVQLSCSRLSGSFKGRQRIQRAVFEEERMGKYVGGLVSLRLARKLTLALGALLIAALPLCGSTQGFSVPGDLALRRIKDHLDHSLMLVTALNPHIRCGKAAKISLAAYREDISLRETAMKLGFLTAEQFDSCVRPRDMTHPLGANQ